MDRFSRRRAALVVTGIAGSLGFASALEGCRDATELELEISTDAVCADVRGTNITAGKLSEVETEPPETATAACSTNASDPAQNRIGSIMVVPSGDKNDKVAVRVVTALGKMTPDACIAAGYKGGCIVARRSLRYQPHETIRLPIQMAVDCLDVPCLATQTCYKGKCVSAEIPDPENCTEPGGCGVDAGVNDASPDAKDATPDAKDATPDANDALDQDGSEAGDTSAEPGPEPIPEAGPEAEPEPPAEAGPDVEPEPPAEAGPDVEPEPPAEAGPDVEPEPEPEPVPEPVPEAGPDSSVEDTGPDAIPCAEGTADCDNDQSNGCEVTLTTDAANCGACGHGCLGAACTASMCEPVVIATGQVTPTGIATDGAYVYFTNAASSGAVKRVPVDGSTAPVTLATASNPFWVATDGAEVFWTAGKGGGGVYKANIDGTGLTTLAASQSSPKGLVIDSTDVFWVNQWGTTNRIARDGTGGVQSLAQGMNNPTFIAADVSVFVSVSGTNDNNGSIQAGSKLGGDFWTPLYTPNPMGIVADSVAMYWVSRGTGNKYVDGAVNIYVYPQAHTLAGSIADGWGIAVDPDWVYWTSQGDGRLERVRRDATGRQVLISGLVAPRAIAVDSVAVYVASSGDGRILRVAK